jgi:hypothetical protein
VDAGVGNRLASVARFAHDLPRRKPVGDHEGKKTKKQAHRKRHVLFGGKVARKEKLRNVLVSLRGIKRGRDPLLPVDLVVGGVVIVAQPALEKGPTAGCHNYALRFVVAARRH